MRLSLILILYSIQVSYENQKKFSTKSTPHKKGSTARIFTNLSLEKVELPAREGYYYCDICKKYTFKENKHCQICNACASKVILIHFSFN